MLSRSTGRLKSTKKARSAAPICRSCQLKFATCGLTRNRHSVPQALVPQTKTPMVTEREAIALRAILSIKNKSYRDQKSNMFDYLIESLTILNYLNNTIYHNLIFVPQLTITVGIFGCSNLGDSFGLEY